MSLAALIIAACFLGTDAVRTEKIFGLGGDVSKTQGDCKENDLVQDDPMSYFDEQRAELTNDTVLDLCTPQDVCFLMRQLDMDFYHRARIGDMRQFNRDGVEATPIPDETLNVVGNTNVKPQVNGFVVQVDICAQKSTDYMNFLIAKQKNTSKAKATATFDAPKGGQFGYKVAAVMDPDKCKNPKCKQNCGVQMKNDNNFPAGCLWGKEDGPPLLNIKNGQACSGNTCITLGKGTKVIQQLCQMDRSLSKAGSMYFSPYKQIPQSGNQQISNAPEKNPSCSFGAMASLAHQHKTERSACAYAIANENKFDGATRCVLLKLISAPAPHGWCANIWTNLWGTKTCKVKRQGFKGLKSETKDDEDRRASILGLNSDPKVALTDDACEGLPADTLRNHVGDPGTLGC